MKRITFLLLFISITSQSQTLSGIVNYKVSLIEKKDSKSEKMFLGLTENLYSIGDEFEFVLSFNSKKAIFELKDKLYTDETAAELALIKIKYDGKFMQEKGIVYEEYEDPDLDENYIIESKQISGWKLHNESKKIDNFLCYKATTNKVVTNSAGKFTFPIEAWYCPKINVSYGPLKFGGLPGLILELKTPDAVLGAAKIKLFIDKELEIKELKKFKLISEENLERKFEKEEEIRRKQKN